MVDVEKLILRKRLLEEKIKNLGEAGAFREYFEEREVEDE